MYALVAKLMVYIFSKQIVRFTVHNLDSGKKEKKPTATQNSTDEALWC